jgi:endogenous inhibitor of DNA gyrase (YacG/DUF329 family)
MESGNCLNCGKLLVQPETGRKRKYCDSSCKHQYEIAHRRLFDHVCEYCGKAYQDTQKKQEATFCSHQCYIRYRFYVEEDIEIIVDTLRKRKKPDALPYWAVRVLLGESDTGK